MDNNITSSLTHENEILRNDDNVNIASVDDIDVTCYSNRESDELFPITINSDWMTNNRNRRKEINEKMGNINIRLSNRFNSLCVQDVSDEPLNETNERIGNKHVIIRSKRKKDIYKVQNVNHIYASNYPERNTLVLHKTAIL